MKTTLALIAAMVMGGGYAAAQQAVVSGTILGVDDNPLANAHVSLFRPDGMRPIATVAADADGKYSLATSEKGFLVLRYTGVGHVGYPVAAILNDTVKAHVDVWLQPVDYRKSFDSIRVIGDFNSFVYDSAVVLARGDDGIYSAELPTTMPSVTYQLLGLTQDGAVCAPGSAAYTFDSIGSYRSVAVAENGIVRIAFDSTQLARTRLKAKAVFDNPQMESLARVYGDMMRRREAYQQALTENREAGKTIYQFKYNWSRDIAKISRQLAEEEDTLIRGMLYVSLLDLGTLGAATDVRENIAKAALATIPPTSLVWSANPKLMHLAIGRTGEPDSVYQDYVHQAIAGHPDADVTSLLLYDGLTVAYSTKQTDRAQEYYTRLTTQYSHSRYAAMARMQFTMAHQ
jgi:hypothetical protein